MTHLRNDSGGTAPGSAAELERRLTAHAVPCATWGTGGAKSVTHLWREIAEGESELTWDPLLRRVTVVSVHIRERGRLLTETGQTLTDGTARARNAPPSEKMKPGETPVEAALRCLAEELGIQTADVTIDPASLTVTVDRAPSPSYPGLPGEYRLHTVNAEVSGLPATPFTTRETPGTDAAVTHHHWEWR